VTKTMERPTMERPRLRNPRNFAVGLTVIVV